ncbi:hypothetical protein [Streptomyces bambusae]|uniref:Secreted protein n=1 Tax=Streptomyces bambusae TaxID=1550616 RepID=A0ABS6ZHA9_9ACTN|nr:hypothetical protein [Streptomyces bambusae]MBW5487147.1 hypothetical protein [Streptomyces bambusae]
MVTDVPRSGIPRARSGAGPLRLLVLVVLLFAFFYTHAASPEGSAGHLDAGAGVPAAAVFHGHQAGDGFAGHHGEDSGDAAHPAQTCVTGLPQQGPDAAAEPAPCPAAADLPSAPAGTAALLARAAMFAAPPGASGAVLRI